MLFDDYNEFNCLDNVAIRANFEELYQLINGKTLKENEEIIYAVCTFCRDYEEAGVIEGIKVGVNWKKELNTP